MCWGGTLVDDHLTAANGTAASAAAIKSAAAAAVASAAAAAVAAVAPTTIVPVMPTSKQPSPAVMAVAAVIAAAIAVSAAAIAHHGVRFAARRRMMRMTTITATPATPAAAAAAAKEPGVGLRLKAHDDDAHRRQTQRQSDQVSLHRSTSKNEQVHRSSIR
jgi:hypothetical protein